MSFWSSLSKLGHFVEKKVEQTVKHVANDVKKVEKSIQQTVQQAEKKVEPVVKQVVKDTVHISQQAKEAFHQAEKKAEQMGKHVAHEVKQAEKAAQKIEKKMEHAVKQAVKDTVHISEKAQKVFHEAEKKTEQAVKHIVHDGKKMVFGTVHSIRQKIKQEIQETEKTIERDVHQLEKKAEHAAKQAVHGIINAEQNAEPTVRQAGKTLEKSIHEFSKHPIDSTIEFVRGAGDAALQDVTYNLAHRSYHSPHPVAYELGQMTGHAVSTLAGTIETVGFTTLEVGGIAISSTGVGAAVGAPAAAIAAVGATHGATLTATGGSNFVQSAKELYQRMSQGEGVSTGRDKEPAKETVEVVISRSKYPEAAQHIEEAIKNGHPDTLTISRKNAKTNRKEALKGHQKVKDKDLDEYPPAMFKEGGKDASVKSISPSDNRGAGSYMGHQLKKYPDGTKVKIRIDD